LGKIMQQNPIKVRGLYLVSRLKMIKEKLGDNGFANFQKEHNGSLNFLSLKDYPIEELVRIDQLAIKHIFGEASAKNHFKYGQMVFDVIAKTAVLRTYFSLFQKNVIKIAREIPKILELLYPGLEAEVETLGNRSVRIVVKNEPWDINITHGLWDQALKKMGIQDFIIETKVLPDGHHEYFFKW